MTRTNCIIVVLAVLCGQSVTLAAIINVPRDQPTIQAGINAAVAGDEVVVAPGTYFEIINFAGKAITVRSTDPNDAGVVMNTIIDGSSSPFQSVVTCNSGEGPDTVLSGFVITGGDTGSGGGMVNNGSSPTVTNCSFIGNTAAPFTGSGMHNQSLSNPTVTNTGFCGDTISGGYTDGGGNSLEYCTLLARIMHEGRSS